MNLIGKSAFSATREPIGHFGSTFTLGRRRPRLERANHAPVRSTRFSRLSLVNSWRSSVDIPGARPSSISAWETHRRKPKNRNPQPASNSRQRLVACSNQLHSSTPELLRISSRHSNTSFQRDPTGPLTRSQNTCPPNRGNSTSSQPPATKGGKRPAGYSMMLICPARRSAGPMSLPSCSLMGSRPTSKALL